MVVGMHHFSPVHKMMDEQKTQQVGSYKTAPAPLVAAPSSLPED